jgi:purine-binding chemotaxis protein CheW
MLTLLPFGAGEKRGHSVSAVYPSEHRKALRISFTLRHTCDVGQERTASRHLLTFLIGRQRLAVDITVVERVVAAVAVAPLPQAPDIVLGVVDWAGRVVAICDVRQRLGLPRRALTVDDRFILVRGAGRLIGLAVDAVVATVECPDGAFVPTGEILTEIAGVAGVARLTDGTTVIQDIDRFLSVEEACGLDDALVGRVSG